MPLCIPDPESWFTLWLWAPGIREATKLQLLNITTKFPEYNILVSDASPTPFSDPELVNKDWAIHRTARNWETLNCPATPISLAVGMLAKSRENEIFAVTAAHGVTNVEDRAIINHHKDRPDYECMRLIAKRASARFAADEELFIKHNSGRSIALEGDALIYYREMIPARERLCTEEMFADVAILAVNRAKLEEISKTISSSYSLPSYASTTELMLPTAAHVESLANGRVKIFLEGNASFEGMSIRGFDQLKDYGILHGYRIMFTQRKGM